ncbi:MAG: DUF3703 domain-containing protein [Rhodospirillaceae bacterium]|nr:DUF3703 domain-containing protein [Rhodospirillaceae bacterium]
MTKLITFVEEELSLYRTAKAQAQVEQAQVEQAWAALERAHILSQPQAWLHTRVHWAMLMYGVETRDWPEVAGQVARILVAGIGSILGKAPAGNTGRSNVGIMQVMPVPPAIAAKLDRARNSR